ncbi:MAG: hypothetical protein AAFQ99_10415, partial [Pseudomonadota bacterium]
FAPRANARLCEPLVDTHRFCFGRGLGPRHWVRASCGEGRKHLGGGRPGLQLPTVRADTPDQVGLATLRSTERATTAEAEWGAASDEATDATTTEPAEPTHTTPTETANSKVTTSMEAMAELVAETDLRQASNTFR